MENNRLDYIDILKGIGILLVIFSHSGAETGAMAYVGGVFIPLFFIASGYTYKNREQSFGAFIGKKSRRLLVPYFFFSVILLLLYKRFSILDIIGVFYSRYCLYPFDSCDNVFLMGGGNPPLWFLTSMLTAFIPFYFLMKYSSKVYWLLLFAIFTFSCQFLPVLLPWSIDTACLQASFMYVGVTLRNNRHVMDRPSIFYLLALIAYIVICILNGELNVSVREYGVSFLLYFLTGVLGTIFLLWFSKKLESTFLCSVLSNIGRHSLVIFCVQMFLLRICHQIFHDVLHFPTEGLLFYGVSIVKILLVAIGGMYLSKGMNRYMPWLFK